jgi:competence protein ComEC
MGGAGLWIDVRKIEDLPADLTPARIIVYQRKRAEELSIGDNIRLTADLRPPSRSARPDGFDFARQNYFDRSGAIAFTARPIELETDAKALPPLSRTERLTLGLAEFRRHIGERIERALPGEVGAIAKALMTGERGGISEETNEAYRDAGIFHILSISGLHMAIMGGSVFVAIRFVLAGIPAIALRWPIKKWAAAAAPIAAFGYLLISGGAHATIRSFIMIVIMFLAILVDRPALAMRNVALAALFILAVIPESLFNAGFQLSFAAVTALVAGYEAYRIRTDQRRRQGLGIVSQAIGRMKWLRGLWQFLAGTIATTLLAGLATAPIAAYHFHQTQTFAVATNLIAVPLSNLVVMPAALAAFLAMPLSLEAYPLALMKLGIDGTTHAARWVAGWSGAWLQFLPFRKPYSS